MNKNKKGFTVIEILIIVCIIIILVTVVLISLISAREKARDNSAFTSFKSLAAPAFMCLNSSTGAMLNPPNAALPGVNICNTGATPDSTWPDLTKSGWDTFSWCNLNSSGATEPVSCTSYAGGLCGGTGGSGDFCFKLKKDSKSMWCTIDGCRKIGF